MSVEGEGTADPATGLGVHSVADEGHRTSPPRAVKYTTTGGNGEQEMQ